MKIYCILMDTVPRTNKVKDVFEKKGIHFADHITCSSTVPTLVTMLSGKTPTEMFGIGGIGHSHTYSKLLSTEKAKGWDGCYWSRGGFNDGYCCCSLCWFSSCEYD